MTLGSRTIIIRAVGDILSYGGAVQRLITLARGATEVYSVSSEVSEALSLSRDVQDCLGWLESGVLNPVTSILTSSGSSTS